MAAHELDRICGTIVSKLMLGERLSADERSHLVESTECMLEVVRRLDQQREQTSPAHGTNGTAGETHSADCDVEVLRVLEQSRSAFIHKFVLS